jgi:hypothetical protein
MKQFRRMGLSLVLAVVLLVSFTVPAMAANPTVALTVTARVIAITNSEATWAIGVVAADAEVYFSATGAQDNDYSRITNTGTVTVDVEIQGTNFSGTPNWTLAATTGADQYSLFANKQATPTVYDVEVKSSSYVDITHVDGLAPAGTNDWSMKFTAPSSFGGTENGTEKTATVTLVASIHV